MQQSNYDSGNDDNLMASVVAQQQQREVDNLTVYMLNSQDLLDEIEHKLRGEVYDPKANRERGGYVKRFNPMASMEGINKIMSVINLHVSKALHLTNFSMDEINRIALELKCDLIELFMFKYSEFHIEKEYLTVLLDSIDHLVFGVLKRALNGGDREMIKTQVRYIEKRQYGEDFGNKNDGMKLFGGN